jgi:hypothetical protein
MKADGKPQSSNLAVVLQKKKYRIDINGPIAVQLTKLVSWHRSQGKDQPCENTRQEDFRRVWSLVGPEDLTIL